METVLINTRLVLINIHCKMSGVANKNILMSSLKLNVDKALSGVFSQKKPYSLACICLTNACFRCTP